MKMDKVLRFIPKRRSKAKRNCEAFVRFARTQLATFGKDFDYESDLWDISETVERRGHRTGTRIVFSRWGSNESRGLQALERRTLFPEPFKGVAKALFQYHYHVHPTKDVRTRVRALRLLEYALSERRDGIPPWDATALSFNRAAQIAAEAGTATSAYGAGRALQSLQELMRELGLIAVPFRWRNPIPVPDSITEKTGPEFERRRQDRLPSPAALDGIARSFRLARRAIDRTVSAVAAIMCSAPDRISEVLLLPVECTVELPPSRKVKQALGLRWRPVKSGAPMTKWVPEGMVSVVEEAIDRIRTETEEARRVARWYEKRPRAIYLPEHLEHLRGEDLSMAQLADVLFEGSDRVAASTWCKDNGVTRYHRANRAYAKFADVQKKVLGMLPRDFPILDRGFGLRYSEALFVIRRNQFSYRATYRGVIQKLTYGQAYVTLAGRGRDTIFTRLGLTEEDGSHLYIRPHEFRHYLDMLGRTGGLSEMDIAKWAGRAHPAHNAAYDHVSGRDLVAQFREAIVRGDVRGGAVRIRAKLPVSRGEFAQLIAPTAHITDFGFCIHDFSMSPCRLHRDCINCEELVCIKGDAFRAQRLKKVREDTEQLLQQCFRAEADGSVGANRWVEHHQMTLSRLNELIGILESPDIPDGAFIRLDRSYRPSRLVLAERARDASHEREPYTTSLSTLVGCVANQDLRSPPAEKA